MNILCVSSSEMGLWMNIVWIYRWFKERSKRSKGSRKVQSRYNFSNEKSLD